MEAVFFSVSDETSKDVLLFRGEVLFSLFGGYSELMLIAGVQQLAEEIKVFPFVQIFSHILQNVVCVQKVNSLEQSVFIDFTDSC